MQWRSMRLKGGLLVRNECEDRGAFEHACTGKEVVL